MWIYIVVMIAFVFPPICERYDSLFCNHVSSRRRERQRLRTNGMGRLPRRVGVGIAEFGGYRDLVQCYYLNHFTYVSPVVYSLYQRILRS
jgi:hypothetical protein